MNKLKTDMILIDDLNYQMEIDSSVADYDELINLSNKDLKKHTLLIAENFDQPFYIGGIGHMSDFCHIHESYSLKGYAIVINSCK